MEAGLLDYLSLSFFGIFPGSLVLVLLFSAAAAALLVSSISISNLFAASEALHR